MRPNIDLPWSIHGQIKEHAEVQNIALETAYKQILQRGLNHTAQPKVGETPIPIPSGSLDRVHFTPVDDEDGQGVVTFGNLSRITTYDPAVVLGGTADESQSWEEFRESLGRIAPYLPEGGTEGWFSIDQTTGAWFGRGLEDFVAALTKQRERYDRDKILNPHNTESAKFLCPFNEGVFCLALQPILDGEATWRLTADFLTDGIPLDTAVFREIARHFSIDLTNAHIAEPRKVKLPLDGKIEAAEQLTGDDEKWVTGLIARNPLYDSPELLSDVTERPGLFRDATAYEYAEFDLPHHHLVDEDREYRLKDATLRAGFGFGTTNIHFRAAWIE